jgi:hypothetical protein
MQAALMEQGVSLHESTCRDHVQKALNNEDQLIPANKVLLFVMVSGPILGTTS